MTWLIVAGASFLLFIVFTIGLNINIKRIKEKYNNFEEVNQFSKEELDSQKYIDYKSVAVKESIILLFLLIPLGYSGLVLIPDYNVVMFQNRETVFIGLGTMGIFCLLNYAIIILNYKAKMRLGRNSR